MDVLVWTLAGIFLVNVVIVVLLGIGAELTRRREEREVRELEVLFGAPAAVPAVVQRRRGGRPDGKHVAVAHREPRARPRPRERTVGRAPVAIATASIVLVTAAALVFPPDDAPPRGPGAITQRAADVGTGRGLGGQIDVGDQGTRRYGPTDPPQVRGGIDEPVDLASQHVVISDGEGSVPAVVAANPASATAIHIEWVPVPRATGYRIDRWADGDPGVGWWTIAETVAGFSTYTDTGLEAATTYYYRVAAVLIGGESAPASDVVHATTLSPPPQAPTLTGLVTGGEVVLEWSDVEGETGYRIERLAPGETDWTMIATSPEGVVTVRDGIVIAGATYQYRVIATGVGGDSEPSNVVSVEAPTPIEEGTPSPDAPEDEGTAPGGIDSDETAPGGIDPGQIESDVLPSG
jgi:Fibronectin type III domain